MSADPAGTTEAADAASPTDPTTAEPAGEQRAHLRPVPDDGQLPDDGPAQTATAGSAAPDVEAGEDVQEDASRWRVDLSAWIAWLQETFRPDSGMFSTRPLAADEVVDRAKRGPQMAEAGPLRTLAVADSYVAAGVKVLLRCGDWLLEHPARRVVATVLLAAALLYPPTRAVIGYALMPIAALHDLLT